MWHQLTLGIPVAGEAHGVGSKTWSEMSGNLPSLRESLAFISGSQHGVGGVLHFFPPSLLRYTQTEICGQ